jgi:hypothetical protein
MFNIRDQGTTIVGFHKKYIMTIPTQKRNLTICQHQEGKLLNHQPPHWGRYAQSNVSLLWGNNVFFFSTIYSNAYGD